MLPQINIFAKRSLIDYVSVQYLLVTAVRVELHLRLGSLALCLFHASAMLSCESRVRVVSSFIDMIMLGALVQSLKYFDKSLGA